MHAVREECLCYIVKQSYFIGTRNAVKVSLDFGYVWGTNTTRKTLKMAFLGYQKSLARPP